MTGRRDDVRDRGGHRHSERAARTLHGLMTDGRSLTRWWAAIAVVAAALVLAEPVLGLPGPDRAWWLAQRVTELWVVSGLIALALGPILRSGELRTAPKAPAIAVMVLAGGLLVSQHGPGRIDIYPFVEWGMYTSHTERIFYTQYLLVADGSVDPDSHVRFDETLPVSMRTFIRQLNGHVEAAASGDPDALELIENTLAAVVPARQQQSSDAVMIQDCEVRAPWSSQPMRCEDVLTVPLPAASR
jgi:hypothetical protein